MICQKIADFYQTHYTVKFINYLEQTWKDGKTWECFGAPKKEHLFLLFVSGGAVYVPKEGKEIRINEGDLVYTSKQSEYHIRFCGTEQGRVETVAVRFALLDERGEDILISNGVLRFSKKEIFTLLFNDIKQLSFSAAQLPVKYDCVLYTLFSELGAIETLVFNKEE